MPCEFSFWVFSWRYGRQRDIEQSGSQAGRRGQAESYLFEVAGDRDGWGAQRNAVRGWVSVEIANAC